VTLGTASPSHPCHTAPSHEAEDKGEPRPTSNSGSNWRTTPGIWLPAISTAWPATTT